VERVWVHLSPFILKKIMVCTECNRAECRVLAHQFATNGATNKESHATNGNVTKKPVPDARAIREVAPVVVQRPAHGDLGHQRRTANRRTREVYNAYQREYMMVSRAIKAGRASRWPKETT